MKNKDFSKFVEHMWRDKFVGELRNESVFMRCIQKHEPMPWWKRKIWWNWYRIKRTWRAAVNEWKGLT